MRRSIEDQSGDTVWRSVLPGMLDVGFSSIATFAVGLYAAHSLGPAEFGVYALFTSAFIFAAVVPAFLVLFPSAFAAVSETPVGRERLNLIGQTWRLGAPTAFVAAALASLVAGLTANEPARVVVPLALTCTVCATISPLQDHVRRTLHMGSCSWSAMVLSLVQVSCVGISLALLKEGRVAPPWRPFTALAIANTISFGVGLALGRKQASGSLPRYEIRTLTRSGRWLVTHHLGMAGGFFGSTAVVTAVAGRTAIGQAEAARLVAQPLYVLMSGLCAITQHLSFAAGERRDSTEAHRVARIFVTLLVIGGATFGIATARPWWGNPFPRILPAAYARPGLVTVCVVAFILHGTYAPFGAELLGAGRRRVHALVAVSVGVIQCLAAVTAVWLGPFSRPLVLAGASVVIAAVYLPVRRAVYRDRTAPTPTTSVDLTEPDSDVLLATLG